MNARIVPIPREEVQEADTNSRWEMKELKPWHLQLCSLLAQGTDRETIATILDCTPNYVSMLARQEKIQEHVKGISAVVGLQLEMQYGKVVTAIGDALDNGNYKEKMQAARLHLEATKRIGPRTEDDKKLIDTNARLVHLAERLLFLQGKIPTNVIEGEVIENEKGKETEDGNWSEQEVLAGGSHQPAQEDGNGGED